MITSTCVASTKLSTSAFLFTMDLQLITATFRGVSLRPDWLGGFLLVGLGDEAAEGLPRSKTESGDVGASERGLNGLLSSKDTVSNNVEEKLGNPHVQQCHDTLRSPS